MQTPVNLRQLVELKNNWLEFFLIPLTEATPRKPHGCVGHLVVLEKVFTLPYPAFPAADRCAS